MSNLFTRGSRSLRSASISLTRFHPWPYTSTLMELPAEVLSFAPSDLSAALRPIVAPGSIGVVLALA